MKKHVHPEVHKAVVTCSCGTVAELVSTKTALSTETCSRCHPFYTGVKRTGNQNGRVARFLAKYHGKEINRATV